jgi:hypothetical protein
MAAANDCLSLIRKAVAAAHQAQAELSGFVRHDFDRMAINLALVHLEHALAELSCFAQAGQAEERGYAVGKLAGRNERGIVPSRSTGTARLT